MPTWPIGWHRQRPGNGHQLAKSAADTPLCKCSMRCTRRSRQISSTPPKANRTRRRGKYHFKWERGWQQGQALVVIFAVARKARRQRAHKGSCLCNGTMTLVDSGDSGDEQTPLVRLHKTNAEHTFAQAHPLLLAPPCVAARKLNSTECIKTHFHAKCMAACP